MSPSNIYFAVLYILLCSGCALIVITVTKMMAGEYISIWQILLTCVVCIATLAIAYFATWHIALIILILFIFMILFVLSLK